MVEKRRQSFFSRVFGGLKNFTLFLLKGIYLIPLLILCLWLLSIVYLSDFDFTETISRDRSPEEVEDELEIVRETKAPVPRDHFHLVDAYIEEQDPNPPICDVCHGTYAHSKEKNVRAMLNMHAGFIACSVCHALEETGDEAAAAEAEPKPRKEIDEFLWVDRQTGEIKKSVEGKYGKYPAKIYPINYTEEGPNRIFTPIKAEAAQRFLKRRPDFTSDQVSSAKARLHSKISDKAVGCSDCHKKDGYLDLRKLGFPETRIDHLVSSEFVEMIDKYETFFLPDVLDFRQDFPVGE